MKKDDLQNAEVTGFFSLPSLSLAEHNPDAYNSAMAEAPEGAATCAYCGTGIRHHVIIRLRSGATAFIGTDCAEKIGGTVAECTRRRLTGEQNAERAAYYARINEQNAAAERLREEARAARRLQFADVIAALKAQASAFHASLADQLAQGPLSWKQARYALAAVYGRRNKRNAVDYDNTEYALTGAE